MRPFPPAVRVSCPFYLPLFMPENKTAIVPQAQSKFDLLKTSGRNQSTKSTTHRAQLFWARPVQWQVNSPFCRDATARRF
jgi:hypothetical protein